ncbi:MAG: ThuA domain-containing protein [Planctomycetes bacterium]|nr:ThuA domain-containing protein [Planctomycetota bacterium]
MHARKTASRAVLCLAAVLSCGALAAAPVKVAILTGENNHDWVSTTPVLESILEGSGRFEVEVLDKPWEDVTPERLAPFEAIVLNFNPTSGKKWMDAQAAAFLDAVAAKGKGVVVVHAADNAFPGWREYEKLLGGAWRSSAGHGSFHAFAVEIVDREHPITRGLPRIFEHAADELYHGLTMEPGVRVLALAFSSKARSGGIDRYEPMAWTLRYGRGRVFHTPLGHAASSMESAGFVTLLLRGTEWAATGDVTLPGAFPEWRPLTNGKDLSGWVGDPKLWRAEGGTIVGESPGIRHNSFLRTERRYGDFVLKVKVRLVPDEENSGIQLRSEWLPSGEMYGYQADIGKGWWGSLYDESTGRNLLVSSYAEKGSKAVLKNDWNEYEVEAIQNRVKIRINGVVTTEFEDTVRRPDGHIAVQVHAGGPLKVEFKDLLIQER